ncbi:hypothetical protein [Actinoplanes sp. NPDC049599]|uniref:hypothetical protein n=1 Tax=Actinoplanes sp. NPDC049599 TaxID=3363903 RepID=UPI0037BC22BB
MRRQRSLLRAEQWRAFGAIPYNHRAGRLSVHQIMQQQDVDFDALAELADRGFVVAKLGGRVRELRRLAKADPHRVFLTLSGRGLSRRFNDPLWITLMVLGPTHAETLERLLDADIDVEFLRGLQTRGLITAAAYGTRPVVLDDVRIRRYDGVLWAEPPAGPIVRAGFIHVRLTRLGLTYCTR